eukprot:CAMPEP_0170245872 /NCGR_PEP_ID=MMETSP0116_2-20130129/22722_1 /TAXON_ID=400756 /ORGANISM="Durinskia baltica, Strain CSIRO CS-38" /LENGTH=139 /DNA_ID=CAMNT_0010496747 /DNA_START=18 /DNA_END=433 /DNA_ORIENTATION=-
MPFLTPSCFARFQAMAARAWPPMARSPFLPVRTALLGPATRWAASSASRGATGHSPGVDEDWVEVADPHGSGKTYWWNRMTNKTTHLGATKPGTLLAALKSFKDDVSRDIHTKQRTRIFMGDGGYYCAGGGGGGGIDGG